MVQVADYKQMSTATRLLETGFETKFHALQIIFVRMLSTAVLGSLYMWYKKVPDFPLGDSGVRGLLVLRGTAGFLGLFGAYCESPPFEPRNEYMTLMLLLLLCRFSLVFEYL